MANDVSVLDPLARILHHNKSRATPNRSKSRRTLVSLDWFKEKSTIIHCKKNKNTVSGGDFP
jgi:hypothetical protein